MNKKNNNRKATITKQVTRNGINPITDVERNLITLIIKLESRIKKLEHLFKPITSL